MPAALLCSCTGGPCIVCQELLAPGRCRVDGQTWDLIRPLEGDCQLELLDFEHPLGKDVRAEVLALPTSSCRAAVQGLPACPDAAAL